jgi:exosortase
LDYPVAQNGVMIMIGSYELMVKDACAGMNSIFALSAIGVFYIHEFALNSGPRSILLMMSIIPITILANFARVMALVLIAYYTGVDSIEGVFHDLTGFALFVVALAMFFLLDATCLGIAAIARFMLARGGRRPAFVGSIAPPVAANGTSGASGDALRDPSSL